MKLRLDANLSPLIASHLVDSGHEAVHVRDLRLNAAQDDEIMDCAAREGYVIVSQDTDFTNLLYYRQASSPSVILLRNVQEVSAADIADLIGANIEQIRVALDVGAVVSMIRDRLRIRRLPIE